MQAIVGWVVEQFVKYEIAKPTARNLLIGFGVITTSMFSVKLVKKITEKPLPTSGYVLITGAASGLGRTCTVQLAEQGYHVIAGVRKQQDFDSYKELNKTIKNGSIIPIMLDVTSEESIDKAFAEVTSIVGTLGLRALINNAGISQTGPCEFLSLESWKSVFNVNFFGFVKVTQSSLPLLRLNGNGRILNMSSPAAWVNVPLWGPYCSSKTAIDTYSNILRMELLRQNIKVIVLEPAALRTSLVGFVLNDSREMTKKNEWPMYKQVVEANNKFVEATHNEKATVDPKICGIVVLKALTSEHPEFTYRFGNSPPSLIKYINTSTYLWIWHKIFGL